jgi:cytochrome c oxidase subunit 3
VSGPSKVELLAEQFDSFEQQDHALRLGMWAFLGSELLLFAGFFALYAAYRTMYGVDFAAAIKHNTLLYGTINTLILLTSSFTVALTVWAIRLARPRLCAALLGVTLLQGGAFLVIKGIEYAKHIREGALFGKFYHFKELPTFGANRFFTLYWATTGLHALHVTAGMGVLGWMLARTLQGRYTPERHTYLEMGTLYWHLVDVIWIFLWPLLYLSLSMDAEKHHLGFIGYLGVYGALILLAALSLGLSFAHLGNGDLILSLVIAFIKALLVLWFFMHLYQQRGANRLVVLVSFVLLAILVALTAADVATRHTYPRAPLPSTDARPE